MIHESGGQSVTKSDGRTSNYSLTSTSKQQDGSHMRVAFVRYGIALLFSVPLFAAPPPSVILSRTDGHTPIFISASAMVAADGTTASVVPQDWRAQQQRIANVFAEHRG